MKQEVKVDGMKCEGCKGIVTERFQGLPKVEAVEVDLENKTATLETEEKINIDALQQALEGTKFTVSA